jgi:hypothetical protein
MLLELSISLLENIYSTGVTHDDRNRDIFIVLAITDDEAKKVDC